MSPRAKRPAPASPRTAIGIDVGGTGVKAAVVDLDTGALGPGMLVHVAYLTVMGLVGLAITSRRLERLLLK